MKSSNLISLFDSEDWQSWFPRESKRPVFDKEKYDDVRFLKIAAGSNPKSYGKWHCQIDDIKPEGTYRFSVEYLAENIVNETVSISAILNWIGKDGKIIQRDYADEVFAASNGWSGLCKTIEVPGNTCMLKVELVLRWPGCGSVVWRNPYLEAREAIVHRKVKVATTYLNPYGDPVKTMENRLEMICRVVDHAGKENPDIICLSENINDRAIPLSPDERAETIPGRYTKVMSEKAKQHNCYIVFSLHEIDGEDLYNTAVLVDRKGDIAGKYRKVHLSLYEGEEGVIPGDEYPVFETDFGRIGIMICWDHWFPESARILRLKGAEILFIPTAGDARIQSFARAVENGVYVVIAGVNWCKNFPICPSRIINPLGEVIGEVKDDNFGSCVQEIDLDQKVYEYWMSVGPCYGQSGSIYIKERRPDTYDFLRK